MPGQRLKFAVKTVYENIATGKLRDKSIYSPKYHRDEQRYSS
jgi:hypothetical protein